MEQEIIKIITKKEITLNNLIETLNLNSILEINNLKNTLTKLISDKKIFLTAKKKYSIITKDHIIAPLESCLKYKFITHNNERIIIPSENLHTALKDDLVVIENKFSKYGEVVGIIKRKNNKLVCEVKEKNNKLYLVPFNGNVEISITIPKEQKDLLTNYIIGDRVYVELDDNIIDDENTIYPNNVTKIGHFNDKMNDEIAIAISKDFDIDFSLDAIKEAELIPDYVTEEEKKGRVDLTEETIFTIDSITTKDMDDAISIKKLYNGNYCLGVHIADVSHYIKPGTALFKDALKRATSVYLGDVVIPMIPSNLSNGICSLNEDVERLTKSCIIEITPKGKIAHYKIVDSVIKSKKKMTYEDLNELFEKGEIEDTSYYAFSESLNLARELSNILTNKKNKRGNLDFESSDMKVKHDDDNKPQEFIKINSGEAEKLIENFMILANEVVATHFYWRHLPFVYRVHSNPDEIKIDNTLEIIDKIYKLTRIQNAYGQKAIQSILNEFKDTPDYTIISNLLLRNMAKAKYSTDNQGHYALALDNYCHFTSPIRRFPDLIVHTLINIFINNYSMNNYSKAVLDNLNDICAHSSYKERQANDAESDHLKLKMAKYMQEHINEEFEGFILDIDKDRVFIKLNNNIKGILDFNNDFYDAFDIDFKNKVLKCNHSKQKIHLGTKIIVKPTIVDIPQKEIYFEIKEIIKNNTNTHTKKLELK